jgi:hypothetical protein
MKRGKYIKRTPIRETEWEFLRYLRKPCIKLVMLIRRPRIWMTSNQLIETCLLGDLCLDIAISKRPNVSYWLKATY